MRSGYAEGQEKCIVRCAEIRRPKSNDVRARAVADEDTPTLAFSTLSHACPYPCHGQLCLTVARTHCGADPFLTPSSPVDVR
jgi:hypothetical protein